jgi:hypothetical protein
VPNEPTPAEPKRLRASDADRERVAQVLHRALGEGRLTASELDERLGTVYNAKTLGELEPVTADLPVPAPAPEDRVPAAQDSRIGGTPTSTTAIAVMGGADRDGRWVVPGQFNAVAVMGGVDLDLTQAQFASRDTTITVFTLMGGVDIVVPDDVEVHVNGAGLMGAFEDHTRRGRQDGTRPAPPHGAPIVRINGLAIMGGVDVKRPTRKKDRRSLPE